jgi:hypothetical protein
MPSNSSEGRAERSMVKRFNRRLAYEGLRLQVNRGKYALARYVLIDLHTGNPVAWADNVADWARETDIDRGSCGMAPQTPEREAPGGDAHRLEEHPAGGTP